MPVRRPQAALQIVVERLFDERGERSAARLQSGEKLWVMGLDDPIERGLLRTVAHVSAGVGGLQQSSSPGTTSVDEVRRTLVVGLSSGAVAGGQYRARVVVADTEKDSSDVRVERHSCSSKKLSSERDPV